MRCKRVFINKKDLLAHDASHHSQLESNHLATATVSICNELEFTSIDNCQSQEHRQPEIVYNTSIHSPPFLCTQCYRMCGSRAELDTHLCLNPHPVASTSTHQKTGDNATLSSTAQVFSGISYDEVRTSEQCKAESVHYTEAMYVYLCLFEWLLR